MSISLIKGQKISLDKEAGVPLDKVVMGLGWDPIAAGAAAKRQHDDDDDDDGDIDLDASCVLFDADKRSLDVVWFIKLKSSDGSVRHSGDNLSGAGDGDDEQIAVDLARVPANVKSLVFTVNSFSGQSFSQVSNAYCRLVNAGDKREIARFNLSVQGEHTAQIMARLYRHNDEWKMHAIGENGHGDTIEELMPQISLHL